MEKSTKGTDRKRSVKSEAMLRKTPSAPWPILRRYTDLPALLSLLQSKHLSLLSPSSWDDRNDRNFMSAYAKAYALKSVVALCFCGRAQTYHHWKVFAPGAAGVCIEFNTETLLSSVPADGCYEHGCVRYRTISELDREKKNPCNLPFLKRSAFKDEREYRIIFRSKEQDIQIKDLQISLHAIRGILINPWMPTPLFEAVKKSICQVDGCEQIPVSKSSLIDHEKWRNYANSFATHAT